MIVFKKNIPFGLFAIVSYMCTVLTGWSYGNSYTVYATISIVYALFAYPTFFSKRNQLCVPLKRTIIFVLFTSLVLGFLNGDLKSSVLINISLIMPVSLTALRISYDNITKQARFASLINLGIIAIIGTNLDAWNSNSLAFMIFCGISTGIIWFKESRNLGQIIFSTVYLVFATSLLLIAGSRNAGICIMLCYLMLLLPIRIYEQPLFYRFSYIAVFLATIFATDFMIYILSDEKIMNYLLAYTTSFSHKAWGMDTHYLLLQHVSTRFANLDFFTQLFGTGIKASHSHNLFYQCLFSYGYVGTFLIYVFYAYVFERAYRLIRYKHDVLALSCYIILLGHFFLQIGEVYLQGAETANIMSMLPVVVILQRWYKYKIEIQLR